MTWINKLEFIMLKSVVICGIFSSAILYIYIFYIDVEKAIEYKCTLSHNWLSARLKDDNCQNSSQTISGNYFRVANKD